MHEQVLNRGMLCGGFPGFYVVNEIRGLMNFDYDLVSLSGSMSNKNTDTTTDLLRQYWQHFVR